MAGSVLLYEDDPVMCALVSDILELDGHQVTVCDSIQAVQRAAATDPSALALVDTWDHSFYQLDRPQRQAIRDFAAQVPTVLLTTHGWAQQTTADELGL